MKTILNEKLVGWLDEHAQALDCGPSQSDSLLPQLAKSDLLRAGVPAGEGGSGGTLSAAVAIVAELAEHSLAAAFVYWAQRTMIECLLHSPNRPLAQRLLPSLLDGTVAGAPGLSSATKFMGGLDQVHLRFAAVPGGQRLNGTVRWASNLGKQGFVLAAAARQEDADSVAVFLIPDGVEGVLRSPDLDLIGLRGTNTASVQLAGAVLDDGWRLHSDVRAFLPKIRPALLGLQCGLGLGLARASLRAAREAGAEMPSVLQAEVDALQRSADEFWLAISNGIDDGRLNERPRDLVSLRLRMVELAMAAVQLEVQALGGRGYMHGKADNLTRRWREAAFLPIVTPTTVQLKTELDKLKMNDRC
jgi:alkylation response protein AidB-like acyl-CoA dehydrogenase